MCVSLSSLSAISFRLFFLSRSRVLPPSRELNQVRLYARFTTYEQWRGNGGRVVEKRVTRKGDTEGRITGGRNGGTVGEEGAADRECIGERRRNKAG